MFKKVADKKATAIPVTFQYFPSKNISGTLMIRVIKFNWKSNFGFPLVKAIVNKGLLKQLKKLTKTKILINRPNSFPQKLIWWHASKDTEQLNYDNLDFRNPELKPTIHRSYLTPFDFIKKHFHWNRINAVSHLTSSWSINH